MPRKTALITGASSGLGVQFAHLAAHDGMDVILVARRLPQLEQLGKELALAHGIVALPVTADLGDPGAPQRLYDEVKQRGIDVDVLVNNAGFGSNGAFLDLPLEGEAGMVEVNIASLLKLSWFFGREMRARKSGRILNVASTAGFQPGPWMATYYATKAFVISFSEALADELKGTGVTVTAHCPGATATGFAAAAGNDKSSLFQKQKPADAAEVARHAWRAMKDGKVLAVHGTMNKLGAFGVRLSPRTLVRALAASLNRPPA